MTREEIIEAILTERHNQDAEWGGPAHDDDHEKSDWIAFTTKHLGRAVTGDHQQFIKQMIRVAALAIAAIEWAGRKR